MGYKRKGESIKQYHDREVRSTLRSGAFGAQVADLKKTIAENERRKAEELRREKNKPQMNLL